MRTEWRSAARLLVLVVGVSLLPATLPAQTNAGGAGSQATAPGNPTTTQNNPAAAAPTNTPPNAPAPKNPANAPNNNASNTPTAANNGGGGGGWGLWGLLGLFGLFGLARGRRTEIRAPREDVEPPYRKVG